MRLTVASEKLELKRRGLGQSHQALRSRNRLFLIQEKYYIMGESKPPKSTKINAENSNGESSSLSALAQSFIPQAVPKPSAGGPQKSSRRDQKVQSKPKPKKSKGQKKPKISKGKKNFTEVKKSSSSGLMKRKESISYRESLTDDISHEKYECMICYDVVRKRERIWSCDQCYAIFHLGCIGRWAEKSLDSKENMSNAWRCPGCQYQRKSQPKTYFCFCGKFRDVENQNFLIPHSCGKQCGKSLDKSTPKSNASGAYRCIHKCTSLCHPGPCDPCNSLAPPNLSKCYCGKKRMHITCADLTGYSPSTSFGVKDKVKTQKLRDRSCSKQCGKQLNCGKHYCEEICHSGSCPDCSVMIARGCYCGKSLKYYKCGCSDITKQTENLNYSCNQTCMHKFRCGIHFCQRKCHKIDDLSHGECPFSSKSVKACHCGKTSILDCEGEKRTKCTDPIPTCTLKCGKKGKLSCGHESYCNLQCHDGPCEFAQCEKSVRVSCRCKCSEKFIECRQLENEKLFLSIDENFNYFFTCERVCGAKKLCGKHKCHEKCCPKTEAFHKCLKVCKKPLTCGNHVCEQYCHKYQCKPCSVILDEPYICSCGKTVVPPPLNCGFTPPDCPFTCTRPRPCGHDSLVPFLSSTASHGCHPDSVPCAPCMILVEKPCLCGKSSAKVACSTNALCPNQCGKILECGHKCDRGCHSGACLSNGEVCRKSCGKLRSCGHFCLVRCSEPHDCEESLCLSEIEVSCPCGNIKVRKKCHENSQQIPCTGECAIKHRNEQLAKALGISASTHTRPNFSNNLLNLGINALGQLVEFERQLEQFILYDSSNAISFSPMKKDYRLLLTNLIKENYFGLKFEELDYGSKKSVKVWRDSSFAKIPKTKLSDYLKECIKNGDTDFEKSADEAGLDTFPLRFGELTLVKRSACPLDHNHVTSNKPLSVSDLMANLMSQENEIILSCNFEKKTSLQIPIPDIVNISGKVDNTINFSQIQRRLDLFMTAIREELLSLGSSKCECQCEGCDIFPKPFVLTSPSGIQMLWESTEISPRNLYISSTHISLNRVKIIKNEDEISLEWTPLGADERNRKTATAPKEPLLPHILNWLYWSSLTILEKAMQIEENHEHKHFNIISNDGPVNIVSMKNLIISNANEQYRSLSSRAKSVEHFTSSASSLSDNPFDALK